MNPDTTSEMQESPQKIAQVGICGLINMGNTCFLNSAIQVMRCIPEWAAFCASEEGRDWAYADPSGTTVKVLDAYAELTRGMWAQRDPSLCKPRAFLLAIHQATKGTIHEQLGLPMQNDGHEFMMYALDQFHEALKQPGPVAAEEAIPAVKAWCAHWANDYSPLVKMIFGLDRVTITCGGCGTRSVRWEVFNTLRAPVPSEGQTILEALLAERGPQTVDEYACDTCKARSEADSARPSATITQEIWRMPRNLIVMFRRFDEQRRKIMSVLNYDGEAAKFADLFAADTTDESREWTYGPIGTLDHHGSHFGGHYTAQAYNFVEKSWWHYDDGNATKMRDGPAFGRSSYVVVYRRLEDGNVIN
jgi:ubiquitin C-terminal hydrolase